MSRESSELQRCPPSSVWGADARTRQSVSISAKRLDGENIGGVLVSHQDARLQSALLRLHAAVDVPTFSVALESFLNEVAPHEVRILYPHIESAMRRLIETRHRDDIRVSSNSARSDPNTGCALTQLTQAERELLHLVRQGWSNKEIAAELQKSIRTVKTQLTSVYKKLGVRGRTRLLALYSQPGVMPAKTLARSLAASID